MSKKFYLEMNKPKVILCDIDGTLALLGNRNKYDPTTGDDILNYPIANILEVYDKQKVLPVDLILISGREDKYQDFTVKWLKKYNLTHYKALYMRKSGDYRKDYVIKKEIFEKFIKDKYDVLFVLDDRDQVVRMWRDLGLTCLQVAYGNF
jgi:hypothetical protein